MSILIAIVILVALWLVLSKKQPNYPDKLARFWKKPKYPTKHDIAKKYPKAKSLQQQSLERKRREAREKERLEAERKQAIIDRHVKDIRAKLNDDERDSEEERRLKISKNSQPNNLDKIKNYDQSHGVRREPIRDISRDISIAKFRQLAKMVNGRDDVARRLIEGNLKLFPDKTPDWACDKAISDLERDRRT